MANRSYLYAIDFDKTTEEIKPGDKISGLSEYNYSIPLSFKILVSQESKLAPSMIWEYEQPIAIQGNYEKGKKKLFGFLETLAAENIFEENEFKRQVDFTKEFLNKHQLKNIFLECGELYEMCDRDIAEQNTELFENDILDIDARMAEFINRYKNHKAGIESQPNKTNNLPKPKNFFQRIFSSGNNYTKTQEMAKPASINKQEMWNELGINYWSNVLYFDFSENKNT